MLVVIFEQELQDTLNAILCEALEQEYDALLTRAGEPGGLSDAEKQAFGELPGRLAELRRKTA